MIICKFIGTEFVKLSDEFNIQSRDVTTGATDVTDIAPKFSDTLTLSQPMGGRFCPPLQRSQLIFSRGYVPVYIFL